MFLVDNARLGDSRHLVSSSGEVARRRLSDGREFNIVKRFWDWGRFVHLDMKTLLKLSGCPRRFPLAKRDSGQLVLTT